MFFREKNLSLTVNLKDMNIFESQYKCPICLDRKLRIIYEKGEIEKYACFNCGNVWNSKFINSLYSGNERLNIDFLAEEFLRMFPHDHNSIEENLVDFQPELKIKLKYESRKKLISKIKEKMKKQD